MKISSGQRLAIGLGLLSMGIAITVLCQLAAGRPLSPKTHQIAAGDIAAVSGPAYAAGGQKLRKALASPIHRLARVLEDGVPLTCVTASSHVKDEAPGRFVIGQKQIWFSAKDGSDPRTNGRSYVVEFPAYVSPSWVACAWLLLIGAVALLTRGVFKIWPWDLWRSAPSRSVPAPVPVGREWALDLMRAVAVCLVLGMHLAADCPPDASGVLHGVTACLRRGGWTGVDLFFVLSGYLVSGLMFAEWRKTGTVRLGRFLTRRALKIYPAHWTMIFATLVVASLGSRWPHVTVDHTIGDIVYLQNYIGSLWDHTWSLAVEEHFYLLLALVFAMALTGHEPNHQRQFRFVPLLFCLFGLGCLALRCARDIFLEDTGWIQYTGTHLRLDGLMFGVLLRWWRVRDETGFFAVARHFRWVGLLLGMGLLAPAFVYGLGGRPWIFTWDLTLNYLAGGCLLLAVTGWERSANARRLAAPLLAMGRHSYSIYLWHIPLNFWIAMPLLHRFESSLGAVGDWLVYALVYLISGIGAGILAGRIIEQPILRIRDRFLPARAAHSTTPVVATH